MRDTAPLPQGERRSPLRRVRRSHADSEDKSDDEPLHTLLEAAYVATVDVQKAHRRASAGMSLRHSAHFLIVGSGGGSFRERAMSEFTGTTTKKNTAAAIVTNVKSLLMKSP